MARRPPAYAIDGEPVFVPEADLAWDEDKIKASRGDYPEGEHPVDLYNQGATRCRLDSVQEYLDMGKGPEMWHLKEPPPRAKIEIEALWTQGVRAYVADPDDGEADRLLAEAFMVACKHGVARVENCPIEITFNRDRTLSDETINAINNTWPGAVNDIGRAVRATFRPLDEAEGK